MLHLLAFDVSNPHSVAFQLDNLRRYLQRNARELGQSRPMQLDHLADTMRSFDLTRFEADNCSAACEELANLLFECEAAAYQVSDELQRQYFAHTGRTARMGGWQ